MIDIQLNWSEYFQGEWTVCESSGFGNPFYRASPAFDNFDASKVFVTVSKETDPETGADGAVSIIMNGWFLKGSAYSETPYFRVVSKNSRPSLRDEFSFNGGPTSPYSSAKTYNRFTGLDTLSVTFVKQVETTDGVKKVDAPAPQAILSKGRGYTLLPTSNQMKLPNAEFAPLISPVFYADDVYTFFVEPSLTETTMDKWQGYTIPRPSHKPRWDEYVVQSPPISARIPPKYLQEALKLNKNIPQLDSVDLLALHAIKPNLDALTQPGIAVQFGDAVVGSTGRVQDLGTITHVITSVGGVNLKR
jgi:hypothetical protein